MNPLARRVDLHPTGKGAGMEQGLLSLWARPPVAPVGSRAAQMSSTFTPFLAGASDYVFTRTTRHWLRLILILLIFDYALAAYVMLAMAARRLDSRSRGLRPRPSLRPLASHRAGHTSAQPFEIRGLHHRYTYLMMGNLRLERVKKILALVPPQDASSSDSSEDDNEINITDNTEYSSEPRSLDSSFERLNILENDEFLPEDIIPSTPAISEVLATYNPPQHLPALQSISSVLSMSPSPAAATIVKETRSKKKLTTNLPHSLTKKKKAFLRKPLEFNGKVVNKKHSATLEEITFTQFGSESKSPSDYFADFFSEDVINIIIENTNLYAVQRNLKSINLTRDELLDFIAINLLMGVVKMPSYRDYWKKDLRYNLIADVMSLKRYEQIRQFLHFVDNSQQNGDRYFKVRPILEASIKHKPAIVYFDNFFSSLELINLLRGEYGIFSLGTIRANRLRGCQEKLPSDKDLLKKGRGSSKQVVCNKNKLSVVKWHDNKSVILASSYVDSFPMETIRRYSKETKSKIDIPCPQIVKHYNSHMGGVDLCDMLISLYRTNYKTKRWYMALFSQVLDICVNNAWIMYRKDSARYNKVPNSLKIFRIMIYYELLSKHRTPAATSTSLEKTQQAKFQKIQKPSGPRPTDAIRCDNIGHMPDYTTAPGRCKFCKKGMTNVICCKCNLRLCFVKNRTQ
ncbi:hypothetical protein HW555_008135 [Spodoptera exigua]|uniref:PiggyBac transposable element-derived protein domain-containing protein n=1 Tax=Spodoptera exigua TaxID=7107 RepID=A0A835GEU5_SPOEX|nr:hypothetical protein HW555_008135 [Spodoptera exigua]